MIIDAHCHFGWGNNLTDPAFSRASLKNYITRANKHGIEKTAVWPILHSDYKAANHQVARLVKHYPKRFIGVMFVHSTRDETRLKKMADIFIRQRGFRAIKTHRFDAPINRSVCELAQKYRVPIVYDVMGQLHEIEIFATEYPNVNFIIPHFGSFADKWQIQSAFISYMERFPNVFGDTSSIRRFDILKNGVRRAGAHKVIFGSDGPWLHPGVELTKITELPIAKKDKAKITGQNFLSLIEK